MVKLFSCVNMNPHSVPATQRIQFICKYCEIPECEYEEMESLLGGIDEQHVDPEVAAFEDPLVLAPPISHCYDCNHRLTYNHATSVKCYTLTGAKQISKVTP